MTAAFEPMDAGRVASELRRLGRGDADDDAVRAALARAANQRIAAIRAADERTLYVGRRA